MTETATVEPDLAKAAFQIHCADTAGRPVLRKTHPRARFSEFFAGLSPCPVGTEACSSAHHRARELQALLAPRPTNVVPVATANKTARLAMPSCGKAYRRPAVRAA